MSAQLVRENWRPAKRCQYGVASERCGVWASTKRPRPSGGETWDVCSRHAEVLDRLRENVRRHRSLLGRLASLGMSASDAPVCPNCGKRQGSGSIHRYGGVNGAKGDEPMQVEYCGRCGWERPR